MASRKIKSKDIIEPDIFRDPRESAESFLKVIKGVKDEFKEILKETTKTAKENPFKNADDIIKYQKDIDAINKSTKELNELNELQVKIQKEIIQQGIKEQKDLKEREKLQEQLKNSTDEEIKAKLRLQKANADQRKALADEIILSDKFAGTLQRIQAESRKLRREREELNLETDEGAARLKEINEQLDKNNDFIKENSDKLKQQKLNVGNYKEDVKAALDETGFFNDQLQELNKTGNGVIGALQRMVISLKNLKKAEDAAATGARTLREALKATGILLLIAALTTAVSAFSKSREGVLAFQKQLAIFTATLGVVTGSLSEFGKGLVDVFRISFARAKLLTIDLLNTVVNSVNLAIRSLNSVAKFFGSDDNVIEPLKGIEKSAEDVATSGEDLGAAWNNATSAFDNFGQRVKANIRDQQNLLQAEFDYADALRERERLIQAVALEEEKALSLSDDTTRSFRVREEAIRRASKLATERSRLEAENAEKELEFAETRLRIQLREANIQNVSEDQIRNLIKLDGLRGKVSEEALVAQQDALLKFNELEGQRILQLQANERTERELKQDRLERDLDILIDGFDNQKTINERIIADDRKTIEEREKIFNDTVRKANESFMAQKKVLAELSAAGINIDELLSLDATELNKRIRALEQSEIIEGRTLEVIRERRTVLQDLADIEGELNEAKRQRLETLNQVDQLEQEIEINAVERRAENQEKEILEIAKNQKIITDEKIAQVNREYEREFDLRKQKLKEQLDFELSDEDLKFEEKLLLEKQYQKDLSELELEEFDRKKELEERIRELNKTTKEEDLKEARKLLKNITDATIEELNKRSDARITALDEEINNRKESISRQEQLAQNGLENQLEFEEKKLAEAELAKRQEQEKKEAREKRIAYYKAFAAYLDSDGDPGQAAGKALVQVLAADTIANLLSAYHGVEDTGGRGNADGQGGKLWVLHPHEGVVNRKGNEEHPGLVGAANEGKVDEWVYKNYMPELIEASLGNLDAVERIKAKNENQLLKELRLLRGEIKGKREMNVNWDGLESRIEKTMEYGVKKTLRILSKEKRI